MSPFQIESEILGLAPESGGSLDLLEAFINFITDVFESKRHFDTSHAVLNFFLKVKILFILLISSDEKLCIHLTMLIHGFL